MSFAAVSWAYKDLVTSAKLAQMVENVRTHDHATIDQGQRIGVVDTSNGAGPFTNSTTSANTVTSATFTIPSGLTSGRRVLLLATGLVTTPAGVAAALDISNAAAGQALTTGGSLTGVPFALHKLDVSPPPGSRTWNLTLASGTAGQTVSVSRFVLTAILL